ncbi:efflux RND transporter periplasmic adaptor subunit [Aeoliella sp. ICT_H6.2]|uniref:Efflux RND transporter periplasmic adaptor subunit n=1 Tax=Aeoliella straminimaris TaxID=2954799 RepID=A0A9X2JFZ3_9BACT|nr:efflux RND transporter periplasmic adaptor subunit [Aeoliella straminimaris]MCO6044186.1 efflux RND transporter periplasmic adaptor subunit [Aeoliella straminimaris]
MIRPAFLSLLVLASAASLAAAQQPPSSVRAVRVEGREIQNHHRVTGSLRAVARGDVSALEEGRIVEVTVREGAEVREGDVIARLDDRRLAAQRSELAAALQTAEARVAQRKLEMQQAQRDLDRSRGLVSTHAISVEEFQHRETDAAVAEASLTTEVRRVAEAKSQLELIDVRLADMVVRAPYGGHVVTRHAEPGEWILPGEPFVTLVSTGEIEAWLHVPERYSQSISSQPLEVKAEGLQEPVTALAAKRVSDVDSRTRTFPLVLTLDDRSGQLVPGMSVNVWLPVGKLERRITVPKDAVIRNGREAYVYKAVDQPSGTVAVQTPVVVAFETGSSVAIADGPLSDGDRVVVEGNERLMPGSAIVVTMQQPERPGHEEKVASRER